MDYSIEEIENNIKELENQLKENGSEFGLRSIQKDLDCWRQRLYDNFKSPNETLKRIERRLKVENIMLNDDVKWLLSEFGKYKMAIEKVLEAEPQGEEDGEMLLRSLKSYLQGVQDGDF